MANKKKVEKGIPITVWLDEEFVAHIDEMASRADMSRSRLIRNFIKIGAEDFKTLDVIGMLTLVRKVEAAKEGFRGIIDRVLGRDPE
ncbi:MAG: ribbon-helix-helix protein, CopG family [Syntrophobacteraceae bacterium]